MFHESELCSSRCPEKETLSLFESFKLKLIHLRYLVFKGALENPPHSN